MSLRDRFAKALGRPTNTAGTTDSAPFSPGEPMAPYDGDSRVPRRHDYAPQYNVSARPKANERVSYDTLRGLVDSYDIAQMCIWHRIDSIRALSWSLIPARGFQGDADAAIDLGMKVLAKPDGQHPFPTWLATWLYDILAYDAGTLYRRKNRAGRTIGLKVVDGTTIAPLLDYWGDSPEAPKPAYVQYANGLPWTRLTRDDLIYVPFRPRTNSPYGYAPLESILLNANTDLRFQAYFLQRFTEGNIPQAFASAPETWRPQEIEEFQGYWDAFLMGDQSVKHQIKWMPGGGKIEWSNEKDFSDSFSLFMIKKTCAAYHIVPADMGFTETVNRSSGETQADVQHRIGDLPLTAHIEGILTDFLQSDLGLPVEFAFDTGQEKEDRLALAQAWAIYIDKGMASPDEGREELVGLPADPRRPTPRFYTTPNGPVPLLAINGLGGKVDPETFAPAEDQPTPALPAITAPGVLPAPGTAAAAAAGSAETAYDAAVRDAAVTKDADTAPPAIACAGLAVQAADTGRVLMLQRALDPDDPAAGMWEFPGGHVEDGESPLGGAVREWSEETGFILPLNADAIAAHAFGNGTSWASGIYAGFVYPVPSESVLDLASRDQVNNPDDPDGDRVEAIAWWTPEQLLDNPLVRPELRDNLHQVLPALGCDDTTTVVEELEQLAKAARPKDDGARWPGWVMDLQAVAYWAPKLIAALRGAVTPLRIAEAWLAINPHSSAARKAERIRDLNRQAERWLEKNTPDLAAAIKDTLGGIYTDGYLIGVLCAETAIAAAGAAVDWKGWTPGDRDAARLLLGARGDGAGLEELLRDSGVTIRSIAANRLKALGRLLAEGAARGDSPATIAKAIEALLSNPARAEMIATTELARAVSQASLQSYIANEVPLIEWDSAGDTRVCEICETNNASAPIRPGAEFPSGHTAPPGHPDCRCALVPVTGGA